ncbi:hypothetical protein [Bradyrhizobium sp. CCGUVB23]|uniref:hypothetical protein n=1 Tax=Bradyrhizobium sp. CCGUVB23 TaxID=2949630 RepID=UPI0003FCA1D1|nr:hypothetical protein [Bradyrhizobium sp. CCGUVB23]MCP3465894.1 hypothetical protein [Bradyrhizobium sp. CCGUVB23]
MGLDVRTNPYRGWLGFAQRIAPVKLENVVRQWADDGGWRIPPAPGLHSAHLAPLPQALTPTPDAP